MIVADSSACVELLLANPAARRALASDDVAVPHLIDAEVLHAVRGLLHGGKLSADQAENVVSVWASLQLLRCATHGLAGRIWSLRENLTAYDATYVALAESLDCALVTGDARLGRATGVGCPVVILPTHPPRGGRGKK